VQHDHRRTLLSPECFHLFNDGVIQASILRGAERAELDYRVDELASSAMRDLLRHTFRNLDNNSGEAALEFLLAIADHRLRLSERHTREALEALAVDEAHPPALRLLSGFAKDQQ